MEKRRKWFTIALTFAGGAVLLGSGLIVLASVRVPSVRRGTARANELLYTLTGLPAFEFRASEAYSSLAADTSNKAERQQLRTKASFCLERAADDGYAPALVAIARRYASLDSATSDRTVYWLRRAVEVGDVKSMVLLAEWTRAGVPPLKKDVKGAITLHMRAATLGDPEALYLLGIIHERGEGIPVNKAAAAEFYRQCLAHRPDHNLALRRLAMLSSSTPDGTEH